MISHDLRSPLMAMGNAFTLLKAGVKGDLPDAAKQRIELSARNVDKLIVLVNDLLDFQKLKAGKMELALEPVSLQSIIKDAIDMVQEAARDKNVEIELPEGETIALCDKNKMLQTAVNLISNAIKFSGTDGKVSLKVDENASAVLFSVSDTGPGIPEEFKQRIFEPFEQAPSGKRNEGTGLGLAICRLVVEAHGGTIRADNRADIAGKTPSSDSKAPGSVFTVELPLNADHDAEAIV
jgi:signal transduction histidine kinase